MYLSIRWINRFLVRKCFCSRGILSSHSCISVARWLVANAIQHCRFSFECGCDPSRKNTILQIINNSPKLHQTNIQSDPLNLMGWIMDAMSTTIILLGFSARKHLTTVGIDLRHGDIGWRYLPEKLAYSLRLEREPK